MSDSPESPRVGTAHAAVLALRKRYPREKGWGTFTEVFDKETGRRADAIVVNFFTNSRGVEVQGFEVKADRGDWLNEVGNPSKSASFVQQCNRWWVVAAVPGIVRREELPAGWGLLELHGETLRQSVPAAPLAGHELGEDLMVVLLRHAFDDEAIVERVRDAVWSARKAEARSQHEVAESNRVRQSVLDGETLAAAALLEKLTDIDLRFVDIEALGAAIKALYESNRAVTRAKHALSQQLSSVERVARDFRQDIEKVLPFLNVHIDKHEGGRTEQLPVERKVQE